MLQLVKPIPALRDPQEVPLPRVRRALTRAQPAAHHARRALQAPFLPSPAPRSATACRRPRLQMRMDDAPRASRDRMAGPAPRARRAPLRANQGAHRALPAPRIQIRHLRAWTAQLATPIQALRDPTVAPSLHVRQVLSRTQLVMWRARTVPTLATQFPSLPVRVWATACLRLGLQGPTANAQLVTKETFLGLATHVPVAPSRIQLARQHALFVRRSLSRHLLARPLRHA